MTSATAVDDAIRHCRQITRRCARNFYYGLRLSPEPQRSALYVIYAWMRHADDLVDDAHDPDQARRELDQYRAATDAALAGTNGSDDPVMLALSDVASPVPLDGDILHSMLDGQLADLSYQPPASFDALRVYCEQVASSVGLVCIRIWGYHDEAAPARAIERGIALQLTNILRDFVEDHQRGRVYLPQVELAAAGLDASALLAWTDAERCGAFVLEQIRRAESYYERSAPLEAMIEAPCRPTLRAMTGIYHQLLARMRARPFRVVLGRRVRVGTPRKIAIALQARWSSHA